MSNRRESPSAMRERSANAVEEGSRTGGSRKVATLIEEFNEHLADDLDTSERTVGFYESDLREFARFLEGRGVEAIEDLGVGEVMAFRNHLILMANSPNASKSR